jgi:hypothetical protein
MFVSGEVLDAPKEGLTAELEFRLEADAGVVLTDRGSLEK